MPQTWRRERLSIKRGKSWCSTKKHSLGNWKMFLQFVVPMAHWVAAMNGCHWDAGHQGQEWTLYLLQICFWWPSMTTQMQKVISNCKWCIQHKGARAKVPMQPIIATVPLELLHMDFTSIDNIMELHQSPKVVSVLVFCNHFTEHFMA